MSGPAVEIAIVPVDLRAASDREYAALADFANRMRAEAEPDEPPISLEERIKEWQSIPPFVEIWGWMAWGPGGEQAVAAGWASALRTDENRHMVDFRIEVLPELRRQGIARRLLALLADVATRENRRLMIGGTSERVPAGAAFMSRLGARRSLETHTNQLLIADLDRDLVRRWQEQGPQRASGFELGFWPAAYPEEEIEAVAALNEVMNTAPRGDLDVEDFRFTPERLRQMEQATFASGTERWTIYACERASGGFAGFTEVYWNSNRPDLLHQGATAVFPHYRNSGLGRWLKAAMLDKILQERPQVTRVRTGNADSNAAMLKINYELGFKPHTSRCMWQVDTSQVLAYLAEGGHS